MQQKRDDSTPEEPQTLADDHLDGTTGGLGGPQLFEYEERLEELKTKDPDAYEKLNNAQLGSA